MRDKLIDRLASQNPLTPAACFVLIWTYFRHDKVGLSAVEDCVSRRWGNVLMLPARNLSACEELRALSGEAFDVLALQILKGLDEKLNEAEFPDFVNAPLTGIDNEPYTVRSRNHFLASRSEITWARRQGLSLMAYCIHFMAVPSHKIQGLRIESHSTSSWGSTYLHIRLHGERDRLRIMLWPLQCPLDYPAFQEMRKKPPPLHVRLDTLGNEPALQEEVRKALAEAHRRKITLLIFPELSIPPATEMEIRKILAENGVEKYPILTLFGLNHRRNSAGDLDLNEAVLLGPDGSELHRHRKLAPFTDYSEGEQYPCGEDLERGKHITVLECSFGNVSPLICLDLLNKTVREVLIRSHGNIFAVPSLSPKTSAHQEAADDLQTRLQVCTFVSNHWNDNSSPHRSTSFYQLPLKGGNRLHHSSRAKKIPHPYLLFDLGRLRK